MDTVLWPSLETLGVSEPKARGQMECSLEGKRASTIFSGRLCHAPPTRLPSQAVPSSFTQYPLSQAEQAKEPSVLRQRPVGHEARLAHSFTSETGHGVLCGTLQSRQARTDRWAGPGGGQGSAAMRWASTVRAAGPGRARRARARCGGGAAGWFAGQEGRVRVSVPWQLFPSEVTS